jgi:hypothetical protein
MAVPVRPIFQNGQRLTAERLNTALEFLRTTVRRLSLGPLSQGVASGLEIFPRNPGTSDRLTVNPGVGIDGRGRLMVIEFAQTFTVANIQAALGTALRPGDFVEIRLVLAEDSGTSAAECAGTNVASVIENAVINLVPSTPISNQPPVSGTSCVNPWEDLDAGASGQDCGITLGHVTMTSPGQLQALTQLRQAVSVQVGRVRNANGNQVMFLGESSTGETGQAEMIRVGQPLVLDGPLVANNASTFHNTSRFDQLFGGEVQATLIGVNGSTTGNQVAGMWPQDQRVFVVAGGAGGFFAPTNIPNGQGGLTAVQFLVHPSSPGFISRPGVPLVADVINGAPAVHEFFQTSNTRALVGLSAASAARVAGVNSVPIATSGVVEVLVAAGTRAFSVGEELTMHPTDTTKLTTNDGGGVFLARAAQSSDGTAPRVAAWVIYPPQVSPATITIG